MKNNKILIIDDTPANLRLMGDLLKNEYRIGIAKNGEDGLKYATSDDKPALILLDVMMPGMDGYEVCRRLKADSSTKNIPVLFVTAMGEVEDETKGLSIGAVDYITKPINPSVLRARIRTHLELHLYRENLEELVAERTEQLRAGYIDTVHRLTLISEFKDEDTGAHIRRISYYSSALARQLGMSDEFCESIFYASPMHDIGKVAIPDAILLKPGPLTNDEWAVMRNHTTIGAEILKGAKSPYLRMAIDIAKYHHEKWSGGGYPEGLVGDQIPITARIMNMADQYDALRSKRPYKKSFDHKTAYRILVEGDDRTSPDDFDPDILSAFHEIADSFDDIFSMNINEGSVPLLNDSRC